MIPYTKFGKYLLDLFFPNRCGFCGEVIMWDGYYCDNCFADLLRPQAYTLVESKYVSGMIYVCDYEGIAKEAVLNVKYHSNHCAAAAIAILMTEELKRMRAKFDVIIPVPMSKKRRKERRFNQTELLGGAISKQIKTPMNKKALVKIKDNEEQKNLTAEERKKNVKGVFAVVTDNVNGLSVLLIDDVVTTGSTVAEAAETLIKAGAVKVTVLAFARPGT